MSKDSCTEAPLATPTAAEVFSLIQRLPKEELAELLLLINEDNDVGSVIEVVPRICMDADRTHARDLERHARKMRIMADVVSGQRDKAIAKASRTSETRMQQALEMIRLKTEEGIPYQESVLQMDPEWNYPAFSTYCRHHNLLRPQERKLN